jgi:hypothetical protein
MTAEEFDRLVRRAQSAALIAMPALLILVFTLHFHRFSDFLVFRLRYTPREPRDVVSMLIAAANRWPMVHDPHLLAYLALPLFLLCAFGLFRLGRVRRPLTAGLGLAVTATGIVYLGGLFGMWTALFRGFGAVDPRHLEGAIASYAALTAPQGAFELTTVLSRLAFIGLPLQMAALLRTRVVPDYSIALVAAGSALIAVFADLDNWMLMGTVLMLAGFVPAARRLRETPPAGA